MAWPWLRVKGSCAEPGLTEFESGAERSGNDWVPMLQWSCLWFFNWATSWGICFFLATTHDGSMVLLYMVTWIPSIYPSHVSIYTSTMDPSWAIDPVVDLEKNHHRGVKMATDQTGFRSQGSDLGIMARMASMAPWYTRIYQPIN